MIQLPQVDEIDRLGKRLRELRVEYEKFFNGALEIPPANEHSLLAKAIRQLRRSQRMNSVDRFRFIQLEARYNSYSELFHRRLRKWEQFGRGSGTSTGTTPSLDMRRGVVIRDKLPAPIVEALYTELTSRAQNPRFDLESFRSYLSHQTGQIRRKTGCDAVRFRIVEEGGQAKLKAKPIRENRGEPAG